MWPYWLLFLICAYFVAARLKPTGGVATIAQFGPWPHGWLVLYALFVFMIGLRHEVGADWYNYTNSMEGAVQVPFLGVLESNEPAYGALEWIGVNIGGGIYFVNTVCAGFFTWGLFAFCRAQPRARLALLTAVPYLATVVAMGYTRQGVALGIAMLAIVALFRGSFFRFLLWTSLAVTFHNSAILLLPIAALANTRNRLSALILAIAAGAMLYALLLQEAVGSLVGNYIDSKMASDGAAIRIAMNVVPAVLFLNFRKRFQLPANQRSFWTWISWTALLFVVLLQVSPSSTAVDRVALYWIPLQLFVLSHLPNVLGQRDGKNAVWVYAVMGYNAAVLFIWLTYANMAFAWLPYQFYPWIWFWQ